MGRSGKNDKAHWTFDDVLVRGWPTWRAFLLAIPISAFVNVLIAHGRPGDPNHRFSDRNLDDGSFTEAVLSTYAGVVVAILFAELVMWRRWPWGQNAGVQKVAIGVVGVFITTLVISDNFYH